MDMCGVRTHHLYVLLIPMLKSDEKMLQSWAQIDQSIKWHINMLQSWPPMGQSTKGHTYFSGTPTELGTSMDAKGCSCWVPQYNSLGPILLSCSPTLQEPITLQVPITYWLAWESGVYGVGKL